MNGFAEHRASEASEESGSREVIMTWETGMAMLPLVDRIVKDIVAAADRLAKLEPERGRLERRRLTLSWPERSRRYELEDEMKAVNLQLRQACTELEGLGVVLLHAPAGMVGFPTIVNDRAAYFSWLPGEERLGFWNFAGDELRRPVPDSWTKPAVKAAPAKGKARRRKA